MSNNYLEEIEAVAWKYITQEKFDGVDATLYSEDMENDFLDIEETWKYLGDHKYTQQIVEGDIGTPRQYTLSKERHSSTYT